MIARDRIVIENRDIDSGVWPGSNDTTGSGSRTCLHLLRISSSSEMVRHFIVLHCKLEMLLMLKWELATAAGLVTAQILPSLPPCCSSSELNKYGLAPTVTEAWNYK